MLYNLKKENDCINLSKKNKYVFLINIYIYKKIIFKTLIQKVNKNNKHDGNKELKNYICKLKTKLF